MKKTGRITLKVLLGILIFLLLAVLFVRSPWGQGIIVDKVTHYVSDKTHTKVAIEKLFITFSGDLQLDGLYLEDKQGDTLVYSKSLEADIPLWPIIKGDDIGIDGVDWNGLTARVIRKDSVSGFNYQFLVDAFASPDSSATPADTSAAPLKIDVGSIQLTNFDIIFKDEVSGIDSRVKLGGLALVMNKTDLENMDFRIGEAEIRNTNIRYFQTKAFPEQPQNQEETPMPFVAVNSFHLDNVKANYNSVPDGLKAKVNIQDFLAEVPEANLAQNKVNIATIGLKNSEIAVSSSKTSEDEVAKDSITSSPAFEWPKWQISLKKLALQNNQIRYMVNQAQPKKGSFNPDAIALDSLTFIASQVYLKNQSAGAVLKNAQFREASGIHLNQFNFDVKANNEQLKVGNLNLKLNNNQLKGKFNLKYSSLASVIEKPETAKILLDFPTIQLDVSDAFLFQPNLKDNQYIVALGKRPISGKLNISGEMASLEIPNLSFNWGRTTRITARGNIKNAMEPENLYFNFPSFKFTTQKRDLAEFIKEKEMGVNLPETVNLAGNFRGNPEDIQAVANLKTPDGAISLNGGFKNKESIAFNADLEVDSLQMGKILNNKQLGALNLKLKTQGSGGSMNTLNAKLDGVVQSFEYNGYSIDSLGVNGNIENGKGEITSNYADENIDANLLAKVVLDSVSPEVALNLDLKGARLQALGLAAKDIRTKFNLKANFKGNAKRFDASANLENGVAVYDNKSYLVGDLVAKAHVREDTTAVTLNNSILNLNLQSNASPAGFSSALQRHYESYFGGADPTDTVQKPVKLRLTSKISESPILSDVFATSLKELDTVTIQVDFDEKKHKLTANIDAPYINYSGNKLDSLAFNLDSNKDKFAFNFGFQELKAGPLAIQKTNFEGSIKGEKLLLDFTSTYQNKPLLRVKSEIDKENDQFRFHINPEGFTLNSEDWRIDPANEMLIGEKEITFHNFELSRSGQRLAINNKTSPQQKTGISLDFENFGLAAVLSYLNPEEPLATGNINGNFLLEDPLGNTGFLADLDIREFNILKTDLGTLSLNAEARDTKNYDFDIAMKGGQIDLDSHGQYNIADSSAAKINVDLNLNEVKMAALEGLSSGAITQGSGSFSGKIAIGGTTADLNYDGNFNFNHAGFTVAMLNAAFVMPDETLKIDNEGLYFDNFEVEDANNNAFTVNGKVGTESFITPTFDLQFKAENFKALNSSKGDNELFYGTAVFDADAKLTGDLSLPKLDLTLNVLPETDVTYVIPESELNVEERDGIVIFVNKENPDNILTQTEEKTATVSGYDISARLSVSEDAVFNVIVDQQTGDNLQVKGEGDLNFNIYPNGRTTLSGRYEMSDGHYEMSLYNLVKRRFEIADGSTITWSGDPMDAALNVTAVYKVETSASALMASETSGADASDTNKFRQELPFLVNLNVTGELMAPKLNFGLALPEEQRGAIGGAVYSRLQTLNKQEQQLNKQVFSLLVLNRFFPDSGSSGAGGGTMAMARDNLNDALSDQLNMFSDKLLGNSGVELNFGLDSYTDYQGQGAPQDRTELNISAQKKLFDERLIVSVGSDVDIQGSSRQGEASPVIGNVSLEYLLTEDGQFRLKGFRKNEFENVIDGQLIISGIALIFTKEFNEFDELWKGLFKNEESLENLQNEEKEKNKDD